MRYRARIAATATCLLAAACHVTSDPPRNSSSSTTKQSAATAPDQSKTFFPGTVESYDLQLSQDDREHLTELHALRQIDPCGFVNRKVLEEHGHTDFGYGYTGVNTIGDGAHDRPLGVDSCTIAFPSAEQRLSLRILPGEDRVTDSSFVADASHPGVSTRRGRPCGSRVDLPLTKLAGAPESMRDPVVEVLPEKMIDGVAAPDESQCDLANAVAQDVAAQVHERGIPVHSIQGSPAAKFLTTDPCHAAIDLGAKGFLWYTPPPAAQWPVSWRHPSVCTLRLSDDTAEPGLVSAVIRYGLVEWSDDVMAHPAMGPQAQVRSEEDGLEVFAVSGDRRCLVVAKSEKTISPIKSDGSADLGELSPVVTVEVNGPVPDDCVDSARGTAISAANRAVE